MPKQSAVIYIRYPYPLTQDERIHLQVNVSRTYKVETYIHGYWWEHDGNSMHGEPFLQITLSGGTKTRHQEIVRFFQCYHQARIAADPRKGSLYGTTVQVSLHTDVATPDWLPAATLRKTVG